MRSSERWLGWLPSATAPGSRTSHGWTSSPTALDSLRRGVLPEDARQTARHAAHTLVGSAGTFGFAEASQLGRTLEAVLDEADGTEGTQERAQRGMELVAQLRGALMGRPGAEVRPADQPARCRQ